MSHESYKQESAATEFLDELTGPLRTAVERVCESPAPADSLARALARIPDAPPVVTKAVVRHPWLRFGLITSGALVAALALWIMVTPRPQGGELYAQVRAAAARVDSIHQIIEILGEGGAISARGDHWFARGIGFSVDFGGVRRIDNGRFFWDHTKGNRTITRSKSLGTDELLDQALSSVKVELARTQRFPAGDREIDGIRCECYQFRPGKAERVESAPEDHLSLIFIDRDFLVRRVESWLTVPDKGPIHSVSRWEYNVPVPPNVFLPNFPEGVEIVDRDTAFERLTELKTALHVEEREGAIFAVHRAERFERGGILLLTSVRGTAVTLKKYPLERRMIQRGLYVTDPPIRSYDASPQGRAFHIKLASASHRGIDVQWWLQFPRGEAPTWFEVAPGLVKVELGMTPWGAFGKSKADARGVLQHITWDRNLNVPRLDPVPSLVELAARVYAEVAGLRGIESAYLNLDVRDVNGVPTGHVGSTDEITPEKFGAAVVAHLQYWEREDIDFQIRSGAMMTAPGMAEMPGADLSYYSLVDDATLQRVAERRDIRWLTLRGTAISDEGLKQLESLEKLEHLDLAETKITDAGLVHLRKLTGLKTLDVTSTKVTPVGVRELKQSLSQVEVTSKDGG